jgi:phage FluMu protein Com
MSTIEAEPENPEMRCHYGQLLLKQLGGGIEIKCKRCKRIKFVPFGSIQGRKTPDGY